MYHDLIVNSVEGAGFDNTQGMPSSTIRSHLLVASSLSPYRLKECGKPLKM